MTRGGLVLLVGEGPAWESLRQSLESLGLSPCLVQDRRAARRVVRAHPVRLLLAAAGPARGAVSLLSALRRCHPAAEGILLVEREGPSQALAALRAGAFCCLRCPPDDPRVLEAVEAALSRHRVGERIRVLHSAADWVELASPSHPEYLARLDSFLGELCEAGVDPKDAWALRTAMREILSNAIEWGNEGRPDRETGLSYCVFSDRVVVRIEDQGTGFTPRAAALRSADPVDIQEEREAAGKRPGGFGLLIVRRVMDLVEFSDCGSTVLLTKLLRKRCSRS